MNHETPVPPTAARLPIFCPHSLLVLLWQRAEPNLTREDCEWLIDGVREFSGMHALRLGVVLEGLGCLLAVDQESGYFRDHKEVSDLLFFQADIASLQSGMAYVADASVVAVA